MALNGSGAAKVLVATVLQAAALAFAFLRVVLTVPWLRPLCVPQELPTSRSQIPSRAIVSETVNLRTSKSCW